MRSQKHRYALTSALCFCIFVLAPAQSPNEAQSLAAFNLATNPTSKLAAAEDFIARFPKSNERLRIAEVIAGEIFKIKDGTVALALLERARTVFTSEQEREILKPVTLEVYLVGDRIDDAFALADEMLTKNPDDVGVLVRMTRAGTDETAKKNRKYADVSLQYGLKAIAIVEKDNRSLSSDDKAQLGQLYQHTAIFYLAAKNTEEAKARLRRAAELLPQDPANFALIGRLISADYVAQLKIYEEMPEGKIKQEALEKVEELLDSVIDMYAQAVGLATGRAEYQELLQQLIPDLTTYYQRRHKSTKGLPALINQYRPRR